MSDIAVSFAVLGAAVVLFVWNRFPDEVVAIGAALTLWATGVLDLDVGPGAGPGRRRPFPPPC